jgi:hypothetical protein
MLRRGSEGKVISSRQIEIFTQQKIDMNTRSIRSISFLFLLMGCLFTRREDYFLDPGIPRIETDTRSIAYIRTQWQDGKHIETAYLDSLDRVLEVYLFGRSSSKTLDRYEGKNNTVTITYRHSDSSDMGYVEVDTLRRQYDAQGLLRVESHTRGVIDRRYGGDQTTSYYTRYLDYTPRGDTLITKVESSEDTTNRSTVVYTNQWEKDWKNRLKRHYHLYVSKRRDNTKDTVSYYSRRYAYDAQGQLTMVWYDLMYLADHYWPPGPDTIYYTYDERNRLIGKRYRYTRDMRNKVESDTTGLSNIEKEMRSQRRSEFFAENQAAFNHKEVYVYTYKYERFDPKKHLPLKVPVLD